MKRRIRSERVIALVAMVVWFVSAIIYFIEDGVAPEYNMACCILGCAALYNLAIAITDLRKIKVKK